MRIQAVVATLALLTLWPSEASAECSQALVMSTYNRLTEASAHWQLAEMVTEDTYNRIRQNAGASGLINGIPVGANYASFRQNVASYRRRTEQSWSASQRENVLWTGLDPNSASAYRDCLNSQVFNQTGLQAAVVGASASNYLVRLRWNVPGNSSATVNWTTSKVENTALRTSFPQGDTVISIPRPSRSIALAASYGGYATNVIQLEPLPSPPPIVRPGIAEQIAAGKTFVFATLSPMPGGNVGSIHGGRAFMGTYTRGTRAWSVWGTAHGTGPFTAATYCPGQCGAHNLSRHWDPLNREIIIWGAPFTFDDVGRVYHGNNHVGYILIVEPDV